MLHQLLSLLLAYGALAAPSTGPAAAAPSFALPGPCKASTSRDKVFDVPEALQAAFLMAKTLPVTVTTPTCPGDVELPFGTPPPLLYFFNGFLVI